jgi:hypothetical protein
VEEEINHENKNSNQKFFFYENKAVPHVVGTGLRRFMYEENYGAVKSQLPALSFIFSSI